MALADRIVVMNKGRIEQIGSPTEIYERPSSRFVSEFVGSINVLEAEVAQVGAGDGAAVLLTLRRGAEQIRCHARADAHLPGQRVLVSVRPEKLSLYADDREPLRDGELNVWRGRIATSAYYGDHREYDVEVADQLLRVTTAVAIDLERGAHVAVACDRTDVVVMSGGNGQT